MIKKENIRRHLENSKKESCFQYRTGNVVFEQISMLIKLFDDMRKFGNGEGLLRYD